MILRRAVESVLPVQDNQIALSPAARQLLLKGSYFFKNDMIDVRSTDKGRVKQYEVVRAGCSPPEEVRKAEIRSSSSLDLEIEEFGDEIIHRVNRVEVVSRAAKLCSGLLLACGALVVGVNMFDAAPATHPADYHDQTGTTR